MDIGSILLILGLLILVSLYVSRPLFTRKATPISREEQSSSVLLAEQERVLNALQELDFDHSLGKIPAIDYPEQRAALLAQGVLVLRQLDALRVDTPKADMRTHLEAAVGTRSRKRLSPVMASPDDELEAMLATRRRERMEKAAGFCPQCGKPVQISDKFCSKCGASLVLDTSAAK